MRELRLAVAPTPVAAGGQVTLTLRNGSDDTVGYNLCTSALERRAGDAWEPVPEDRMCTMELRVMVPGGEAALPLDLPPGLAPGDYRYVTSVERMTEGGTRPLASDPFRVAG